MVVDDEAGNCCASALTAGNGVAEPVGIGRSSSFGDVAENAIDFVVVVVDAPPIDGIVLAVEEVIFEPLATA